MSNNNSTQRTREKIEIADYDALEVFEWDNDTWERQTPGPVKMTHKAVLQEVVSKRKSDGKVFSVKFNFTDRGIVDSNEWPLEAVEVFPKQIITTIYE